MKLLKRALMGGAALLVLGSAFGSAQAAPERTNHVTVMVSVSPQAGTILTDGAGRTLYLRIADELNKSNCVERCAGAWPPLLVTGAPVAGPGATARLGTLTRADGGTQATYNGWPLYYFSRDTKPGDVTGQGVNALGGLWFVVSPYGGPRQTQAIVSLTQQPGYGSVLSDASGRTLYLATNDQPNKTNCVTATAYAWPSLLTIAPPVAGAGVNSALLGTTKREEGSTQVTYNGWPLYYFRQDIRPGDTAGQGAQTGCGSWYVVSAAGAAVTTAAPSAPAALPRTGTGGLSPDDENGGLPIAGATALLAGAALGAWALFNRRASV